jgi:hypothetical protein
MDMTKRRALAKRLGRAEVELQRAYAGLDGSTESRTRLALAKEECRAAESAAMQALGVRDALTPRWSPEGSGARHGPRLGARLGVRHVILLRG